MIRRFVMFRGQEAGAPPLRWRGALAGYQLLHGLNAYRADRHLPHGGSIAGFGAIGCKHGDH